MSVRPAVALDPKMERDLLERGKQLLEWFHAAYAKDPIGRETEFRRGQFTDWRHMLDLLFGRATAQRLTETASELTSLSIPPAGPLADDGQGYLGFDSGCHMGYIGELPPE
jgi:hypothetical protein